MSDKGPCCINQEFGCHSDVPTHRQHDQSDGGVIHKLSGIYPGDHGAKTQYFRSRSDLCRYKEEPIPIMSGGSSPLGENDRIVVGDSDHHCRNNKRDSGQHCAGDSPCRCGFCYLEGLDFRRNY